MNIVRSGRSLDQYDIDKSTEHNPIIKTVFADKSVILKVSLNRYVVVSKIPFL